MPSVASCCGNCGQNCGQNPGLIGVCLALHVKLPIIKEHLFSLKKIASAVNTGISRKRFRKLYLIDQRLSAHVRGAAYKRAALIHAIFLLASHRAAPRTDPEGRGQLPPYARGLRPSPEGEMHAET